MTGFIMFINVYALLLLSVVLFVRAEVCDKKFLMRMESMLERLEECTEINEQVTETNKEINKTIADQKIVAQAMEHLTDKIQIMEETNAALNSTLEVLKAENVQLDALINQLSMKQNGKIFL